MPLWRVRSLISTIFLDQQLQAVLEQHHLTMPHDITLLAAAIAATSLFVIWRWFHQYMIRLDLDDLPGPARTSFLAGARSLRFSMLYAI